MTGTSRKDLAHLLLAGSAALALLLAITLFRGDVPPWTTGIACLIAVSITAASAASVSRSRREERFRQGLTSTLTHHLRTSLAHIRAYNEMLLLGRDSSEAERRAWLEIIGREAESLGSGVENVLNILTGDDGPSYPIRRPVDLGALLEDAACGWRNSDGSPVEYVSPAQAVFVDVDEGALRHAVNNLFEVVTRLGSSGSRITVALTVEEGRASCLVYLDRLDAHQEPGGGDADFSLEAIVAERIFRAHGGGVRRWKSNGSSGFRFELPLPVPSTSPAHDPEPAGSSG